MAGRRTRGLAVAVVAAAGLMLPASASAGLSPWLVGASYSGRTTSVRVTPWLGGRGVDQGLQAPEALDLY